MPFNGTSKRFDRIWAFVNQFAPGEVAPRSGFDVAHEDIKDSVNDAIAYLETLASGATDERYIGLSATPPTQRIDTTALQDGDIYVSTDAADSGQIYVYISAAWVRASDYGAPSAYFNTLVGATTAPALRGLLGLGTAATSAATAFATAAQGAAIDNAIVLNTTSGTPVGGTLTDWESVKTGGTNFYRANSLALNAPYAGEAFTGLYMAYAANEGTLFAVSATTNRVFMRSYKSTWGTWREVAWHVTGTSSDLNNMGSGLFSATFDDTATGAPAGLGTYSGNVIHSGTTAERSQIAFISGQEQVLYRTYTSSAWTPWRQFGVPSRVDAVDTTSGTFIDFTGVPLGVFEIDLVFDDVGITGSTEHILVDLMVSGVPLGTGYQSVSSRIGGTVTTTTSTAGFVIYGAIASTLFNGSLRLVRLKNTNVWTISGALTRTTGELTVCAGKVTAASIDGIRLRSSAGVATFSAGRVSVTYRK